MQALVNILHSGKPDQCDLAFGKLADFLGIESVLLPFDKYLNQIQSIEHYKNPENILALGCNTLVDIYNTHDTFQRIILKLKQSASFLFIYGISPGNTNISVLNNITDSFVKDIIRYTDDKKQYKVSNDNGDITKHFSGLSFGGVNKETDFGLEVSDSIDDVSRLITIDGRALFLKIKEDSCTLFLLATNQILDIDQPAENKPDIENYFSKLIPPLMFLKHVFKDHCWHNEAEHACLIIDDPPLKKTYGFVNYNSILNEMDRHDFFTNIAFIPWNYQRTDENIANMFRAKDSRFAIDVHGGEHTGNEFGITNNQELDRISKLALHRMESHAERYSIPYDKVMTFPQGVFTTEAMMVLKSNNYLAAFNTDFTPTGQSVDLKIRDILEPAIMSYFTFPLYYRRPPGEIALFALDLFLGKPALIATHHHNYKNMETITKLVDKLNALSDNLKWKRSGDIVKSSYLTKRLNVDEFQIRLYSPCVDISNRSERSATYHILKKESPEIIIKQVNINSEETPYELNDNGLCIRVKIPPKNGINVEIIYKELYSDTGTSPGTLKKIKVAARRIASEIRDNYIDKQPILAALYKKIRRST